MNRDNSNLNEEDITVETLQDLLIYDDMFLDYFNVFLKLPVFPQPLEYQRLTDSFKLIEEGSESVVSCESPPPFMASEEEHSRLMTWAQKYRLPLFLNTDLFRQLKLAKLLLRPLESFNNESRNTFLRGYSKRSNFSSFTSPTSSQSNNELTTESSDSVDSNDEDDIPSTEKQKMIKKKMEYDNLKLAADRIQYDSYIRPGSEAISLPMQIDIEKTMQDDEFIQRSNVSKTNNDTFEKIKDDINVLKGSRQKSMTFNYDDNESLFYRIQSAPLQFDFGDFDFVYTNKVLYAKQRALNFGSSNAEEEEEEEKVTTELEAMQNRQKVSLYRLKGLIVGTTHGMNEFREFLKNTAGSCLCDFWLDCEEFKDESQNKSEEEKIDGINKLMRNLQDRYKLNLTRLAKQQLIEAMKNPEKVKILFLQTQYDSLRRLRSYWLPRYLLHQESLIRQHTLSDLYSLRRPILNIENFSVQSGVFPKLALEKILPYSITSIDMRLLNWNQINKTSDKKISESTLLNNESRGKTNSSFGIITRSVFQNRLRNALAIDRISGKPFRNYLQSLNLLIQINNLEFYQEVNRYKQLTKRNADRLLRLSHAWSIINRFIDSSSKENIGLNESESQVIIRNVKVSKSAIKENLFDNLIDYAIKKTEQEWLCYLKEDMKGFMESSLTQRDAQTPPRSIDEVEVLIEGESIIVRRKNIIKEFQPRLKTWDTLSKEERQKKRQKALELKRITEIERQKVLKTVALRIKNQLEDQKRLKSMMSMTSPHKTILLEAEEADELENSKESTTLSDDQANISFEDRTPEIKKVLENKILVNLFKKYTTDNAESIGKEALNAVMLLQDLSGYFGIQGYDKSTLTKRDHKSNAIYKSYIEKSCKRPVPLSENIKVRLTTEKMRPKTATLKEIQNFIYHNLADVFKEFWKYETKELGVKSNILAAMSESELQILAENQLNEMNKNIKTKTVNTAAHTKEDKNEFLLALSDAAYGQLSLQMLHFYRYLVEHGPEDKLNNLDKDLFFYTEVLKLKEMCRTTVEEEITRKKVLCISVSFLESVHPPAIQINISNEIAQRAIRAVQRQITSKDINITIFDEASGACLKTLLPYWAGFQRQWEETHDHLYRPVSKYQRILERRRQMYNDIPIPKTQTISLPLLPKGTNLSTLTFSMNDGAKWKDTQEKEPDSTNHNLNLETSESRKRSLTKRIVKGISRSSISQQS